MEVATGITTALATLRMLREMAKARKQTDIDEKLQVVYEVVFNIQHQMFSVEEEARRLRAENEQLKSTKEIEGQLSFDGKVYWRTVDNNKTGPFCPNCWHDVKGRQLMPLQHEGSRVFYCSKCKTDFRWSSRAAFGIVSGPTRFEDL